MNRYKGCLIMCAVITSTMAQSLAFRLPVNPKATDNAKAVLKYMYDITGKGILSGQMHQALYQKTWEDTYISSRTGKLPALYGMDIRYAKRDQLPAATNQVIKIWKEHKSIITVTWHAVQPDKPEVDAGTDWSTLHINGPAYGETGNIDKILQEGSDLNKEWYRRIDMRVEMFFKPLADAGVPILWRPFHEMNGNWFWWSNHGEKYKKLWAQLYKRMVEYHGLNNLLWVYSPNVMMSYTKDYNYNYPGHRYVDVLGHDVYENYGHSYSDVTYKALDSLADGRPIGIAENYKMPPVDMISKSQPRYSFWCVWDGGEGCCGNTDSWYNTVFNHAYTITNDELKVGPWNSAWDTGSTPILSMQRTSSNKIATGQRPIMRLFGVPGSSASRMISLDGSVANFPALRPYSGVYIKMQDIKATH